MANKIVPVLILLTGYYFVQHAVAMEQMPAQQEILQQAPPPPPPRPDLSDPTSNIPMLNLDALAALQPTVAKPTQNAKVSNENIQRCDPALDMAFYNNLETYLCMTSPVASCPQGLATKLRKYGVEAGTFVLGASLMLGYQAGPLLEELNLKSAVVDGPQKAAVQQAQDSLQPFLDDERITSNVKLKIALQKALATKNDKVLRRLLIKLEKYDGDKLITNEVKAAIALFPKSTTGKLLLQMLTTGLITTGISKLTGVLPLLEPTGTNACDDIGGQYTAEDRNDQCRKKFVIDDHVAAFLALPPGQRQKVLNDFPSVCDYYRNFNETLKSWIQPSRTISDLSCSRAGPSYSVGAGADKYRISLRVDSNGDPQSLQVNHDANASSSAQTIGSFQVKFVSDGSEQTINSISFQKIGAAKKTELNYQEFTSARSTLGRAVDYVEGNYVQKKWKPEILSVLTANKLYGGLITMCCDVNDGALRQKCTDMIEKPSAKSVKELDSQINTIQKDSRNKGIQ